MNDDVYRDEFRIEHMHFALERIVKVFQRVNRETFTEGNDDTEIILYNLTILGEAANNVSRNFCAVHHEVDFKGMAGLRHRLIHDYANIDLNRIWLYLVTDVPNWQETVDALYAKITPPPDGMPQNISDFD